MAEKKDKEQTPIEWLREKLVPGSGGGVRGSQNKNESDQLKELDKDVPPDKSDMDYMDGLDRNRRGYTRD